MGFQHLSKSNLVKLGSKAGRSKRNVSTQRAWEQSDILIKQFNNGTPALQIAKDYNIHVRTVYRIVRGK